MTIYKTPQPSDRVIASENHRSITIKASPTSFAVILEEGLTSTTKFLSFEDFYNALSKLESTHPMMEVPV